MTWRMMKAVLILPGTAVVLVPGLIIWAAAVTDFGGPVSPPGDIRLWAGLGGLGLGGLGLGIFGLGICFGFWTASLFVTIGKGTPAPWDPPKKLVVRGPCRHVRNPMITSGLLMLLGEALTLQSWPIGWWGLFFFAANSVYFPLSEEKGLERRFGDDYRTYKANVPRWVPRLTAWRPPGEP